MEVIRFNRATRKYRTGRGVSGVSLQLEQGRCLAVLGRNGSGKSTLTRMILGLERPDSGSVSVLGREIKSGRKPPLSLMGAALEENSFWENLSGLDNAWFAARMCGLGSGETKVRLARLFDWTGLGDQAKEPVSGWSYGLRRKLALIQALVHDPDLLILDEPTAGLDAQFMAALAGEILERRQSGRSVWLAGNDPDWAAETADRVVILDQSRVVWDGDTADLLAETAPLERIRIELAGYAALPRPEIRDLESFVQQGPVITVLARREAKAAPRLVGWLDGAGVKLEKLEVSGGRLKDAYLLKTGRTED